MDARDKQIALLNCNTAAATLAAAVIGSLDVSVDEGAAADIYEQLHAKVWSNFVTTLNGPTQAAPAPGVPQAIENAFPQTQVVTEGTPTTVRVKGNQYGDLPPWLVEAAAKAGVTEVWDNRKDAAGTSKPWFRQVVPKGSGQDPIAFWPPR